MSTLGDKVETAMNGAGIKARTFAALVGCHHTTIYGLLKDRDSVVPLRLVQEKIYDVIDFLTDSTQGGLLPLTGEKSLTARTKELQRMYESYTKPKPETISTGS
jgi:hypothetical protein